MTQYPYPGDDPAALAVLSSTISALSSRISSLSDELPIHRSALVDCWNSETAAVCNTELSRFATALPSLTDDLVTAGAAVRTHSDLLAGIRLRIDELRTDFARYTAMLSRAERSLVELDSVIPTPAAQLKAGQYRNDSYLATTAIGDVNDSYLTLVAQANDSAITCRAALNATVSAPEFGGAGSKVLALAGLSATDLHFLGNDAAAANAVGAARVITAVNDLAAAVKQDTAYAVDTLATLMEILSNDPVAVAAFFEGLGAEGTARLMTILPALAQRYDGTQPVDPETVGKMQTRLAQLFSLGTRGITSDEKGNLIDDGTGLRAAWVDELREVGHDTLDLPDFIHGVETLKSYVPIMATLAGGSDFSPAVLNAFGMDLRSIENHSDYGDLVWVNESGGHRTVQWNLIDPDRRRGADPFVSWTIAMTNSATDQVAAGVLADNGELLGYLLNEREWQIREIPSGDTNEVLPLDEPREGLMIFGAALLSIVGSGAGSTVREPDAAKRAFNSVMLLLGDTEENPPITADYFAETDYVAPEIRQSMSILVAANMDSVYATIANTVIPGSSFGGSPKEQYTRVLADLGKDDEPGPGGLTTAERIGAAAQAWLWTQDPDDLALDPTPLDVDDHILASVNTGLSVANVEEQEAIDARASGWVSWAEPIGTFVLALGDAASGLTANPWAIFGTAAAASGTQMLFQALVGTAPIDQVPRAIAENSDATAAIRLSTALNQADLVYAVGLRKLQAKGDIVFPPGVPFEDSSGMPLPWSALRADAQKFILQNWAEIPGQNTFPTPEDRKAAGSDGAWTAAWGTLQEYGLIPRS